MLFISLKMFYFTPFMQYKPGALVSHCDHGQLSSEMFHSFIVFSDTQVYSLPCSPALSPWLLVSVLAGLIAGASCSLLRCEDGVGARIGWTDGGREGEEGWTERVSDSGRTDGWVS